MKTSKDLESLKEKITKRLWYELANHRLELYGIKVRKKTIVNI